MSDWLGGALVSEVLKGLIKEAKALIDFKLLLKELVSTMERLIPLTEKIDTIQGTPDFDYGDLKVLKQTFKRAREVVDKCQRGGVWFIPKLMLTRKIKGINKDMFKFLQMDLQLLQYRSLERLNDKVDGLSKRMDSLNVPPPSVSTALCSVPQPVKDLVGFDIPLMELKKKLLDDSLSSLVVCAPPGCGKTTLVTKLCHDHAIIGKFNHIFYWVVSSTPNLRLMVHHLLLHNGYNYNDFAFDNDSQAASALGKLLQGLEGNGILLVLDDVWGGAESLLKKIKIDVKGYKILVTSRFEFRSFGPTYHLKPLDPKDAKNLLIHFASPLPRHTNNPDEFDDLLQKILKRCSGFPIVIEVVGSSLKGLDLSSWRGQVESWSEGQPIIDSSDVLQCLQPSFNALKPTLKDCFLDMGSFHEDQKIRASVIIDLWVELYGRGTSSCMKYLNDLASQNLLKLIPLGRNEQEDGFYNEYLVTQHDILRELAIHQSRSESNLETKRLKLEIIKNKFPEWYSNLKQSINASLLSISTDDLFSSKWVEMDCPNVEALILNLSSSDYALPSFIAGMKKLKVLTITNHGVSPARMTNFSCLSSLPNLKRIRLENASVTLLHLPKLGLVSLEKISFVMCSFGDVFYDWIDIDISEALPSLQEIDIDYCYDLYELPYWVSEVFSLTTLSVTNCYKLSRLPEAIGNLISLEVLRVSSCLDLRELPETTDRLSDLRFLDISDCTGLRKFPQEFGKLKSLKKMSMRKCYKCELPDSVKNLENLEVTCDEETEFVLWKRLEEKMKNKNLRVHVEEPEHNLNLLHMFRM
ncbi:Powdery mildew resistance protein [Hirschfeldia incana]|nr:Powdery mildew resistance protein [Hirschfeldia incana]